MITSRIVVISILAVLPGWLQAVEDTESHFGWDVAAPNTIFEKSTGHRVAEAFDEAIAVPLGMENFSTSNVGYIYDDSSDHPAVVFSMSAAVLSKFGLLVLNGGNWGGLQLIPTEWIR